MTATALISRRTKLSADTSAAASVAWTRTRQEELEGQEAELTGTDHWLVLMFATLVTGTVSLSRATTAAVTDQLLGNLPLKRFIRFGQ